MKTAQPLVCCVLWTLLAASSSSYVSVTYEDHKFLVHQGFVNNWVAQANFTDDMKANGWTYLEVKTSDQYPDSVQAYAAGLAEANVTRHLVLMHWNNTVSGYCQWQGQAMCDKLNKFVDTNNRWVRGMVEQHGKDDPYWHQVGLVLQQLQGLIDGVDLKPTIPGDPGILWMNIAGDLEDLEMAVKERSQRPLNARIYQGLRPLGSGHCSALIKVLPDGQDLYTSQVTWSSYQSMLRIQKRYILSYHETEAAGSGPIAGHTAVFSSYPGILGSQDDFYVLSSGLVTQETTIGNNNNDLWEFVTPEGAVLEWVRSLVANNLATDGQSWSQIFAKYNSGTYNNQWMVVDYKRFKRGDLTLRPGLLWVLEQIPGYIVNDDVTSVLQDQQYWSSYNIPYFSFIFNMSGNQPLVEKYGDLFTHDMAPRARIFRRDQGDVRDVGGMMKLMRYNDFRHDPLSACQCEPPYSGENAISARCDLNPANGTYLLPMLGHRDHGGTDMKLTTTKLVPGGEFIAIAGPTYDPLPPFQWSKTDFKKTPHQGHPDLFKYGPVQWRWQWK